MTVPSINLSHHHGVKEVSTVCVFQLMENLEEKRECVTGTASVYHTTSHHYGGDYESHIDFNSLESGRCSWHTGQVLYTTSYQAK